MIYMDLEKIYRERGIPNKYILTLVIAARARQLSERKNTVLDCDEKFITRAVEDLTRGRIRYKVIDVTAMKAAANEPLEV
jgi:DNA-directed RNA polymerase subunit K/omega